jgi:hypothetical protein
LLGSLVMVRSSPRWSVTTQRGLTQWYGHVHLLREHALGQWCCVDRGTGRLLWERRLGRPNTIRGVTEGIIIASETRSDGPWTFDFGIYGIELATGAVLWTSHGDGGWGRFLRALDAIPGFTNELRDSPQHVTGAICRTEKGRLLDVATGHTLRRPPDQRPTPLEPHCDAHRLFSTGETRLAELGTLLLGAPGRGPVKGWTAEARGRFFLETPDGTTLWQFTVAEHRRFMEWNLGAFRLAGRFIYLVTADRPSTVPRPGARPGVHMRNGPALHELWTLDVESGEVLQRIPLGSAPSHVCRMEDLDDRSLLVSADRVLHLFERL